MFIIHYLKIVVIITLSITIAGGCTKTNDDGADPVPVNTDTCGTPIMTYQAAGHQLAYNYTNLLSGLTDTVEMIMEYNDTNQYFKYFLSWGGYPADTMYTKECDGWLYRYYGFYFALNYCRMMKATTALNDTWTYSSETYTVIEKNVSITVPAGTFVCDKIAFHYLAFTDVDTLYFNNTAGDIKYDGFRFRYELISKNF